MVAVNKRARCKNEAELSSAEPEADSPDSGSDSEPPSSYSQEKLMGCSLASRRYFQSPVRYSFFGCQQRVRVCACESVRCVRASVCVRALACVCVCAAAC